MRHRVAGRKLNRTSSHRKALLRNLATQLLQHKRIHTTEAKAKTLRPYVEKLITKAKRALAREQAGKLPQGQTIDVHARRMVGKDIRDKAVLEELFDEIVHKIGDRPGGYSRIVKTYIKRGDSGKMAIIELVDYNTEQDSSFAKTKTKKSSTTKSTPTTTPTESVGNVEEVNAEEENQQPADTDTTSEESTTVETVVEETEVAEETATEEPVAEQSAPVEESEAETETEAPKAETETETTEEPKKADENKEDKE